MNDNVDIFIYTHKPFKQIVHNDVYKVLTCSKEPFESTIPVLRDYEGDSISDKNIMYNEYCGFYWLWKNYDLKKYIGLNHYRRYYEWMDNVPDIEFLFKYFNIILNKPIDLVCPMDKKLLDNRSWYAWWHNVEDFDALEQLYHEKFPEYIDGFEKMKNSHYIYNSSMFTMTKEMFNEYCDYIFKVLEEYNKMRGLYTSEDYINHVKENSNKYMKTNELCGYDLPYYSVEIQSRIVGYIAERAMNTFMMNGEDNIEKHAAVIGWKMVE